MGAHALCVELVGQSRDVLQFGAVPSLTKALVERGCSVVTLATHPEEVASLEGLADAVHVVDFDIDDYAAKLDGQAFEVALVGGTLATVRDPISVLRSVRRLLAPGAPVVISALNVAHVDVRLSLLGGRFEYGADGLLADRNVRLFTLASLERLVEQAGFVPVDVRRISCPAFESELGVERDSVAPGALAAALAHPDAETYEFVVRAIPVDAVGVVTCLESRLVEADTHRRMIEAERAADATKLEQAIDEFERVTVEFDVRTNAANEAAERAACRRRDAERLIQIAAEAEVASREETHRIDAELDALQRSRLFRWSTPARRLYSVLTPRG